MSSIMTSSKLIKSIQLRGFIPQSQKTFLDQDFLDIATEKINISLMREIMTARGDYLIYYKDIPLVSGVQSYAIPDRAHGDKLRDASIVDINGKTKRELTQVSLEELTDYTNDYIMGTVYSPFYLQNNNLVLINTNVNSGDSIRMYFYMRPNMLVVESRAATVLALSQTSEVDHISPKTGAVTGISLTGVITSVGHGLTTGNKVSFTGTDSSPAINDIYPITVIDTNHFSIPTTVTSTGTTGSWALAADVYTISSSNFPKHFTTSLLYDVVNSSSPNNIKLYNVPANSINGITKSMTFRVQDTGTALAMGNYITSAEETIVPNVPTEYHPVVAQMVAVHCMESMADEQQKKSANNTLAEMKRDILSIVQNRVEGAPKKIKNRNSTLTASTNRNTFRRRG